MTTNAVNYDQIAPNYNRRSAGGQPQPILQALLDIIRKSQVQQILEVGCGTGFWLAGLQAITIKPAGPKLFGLDLSWGMLKQACIPNTNVNMIQGRAETLPLGEESLNLIYCVRTLHHFTHQ